MKKISLAMLISMVFFSCKQKKTTVENNINNSDLSFNNYKDFFIEELWKTYPSWASSQGYHKYDSVLIIPSSETRAKEISFANNHLDSLKKIDPNTLSDLNKIDYYIIENQLKYIVWSIIEQKSYEWNPSEYNVCGAFSELLTGSYEPLKSRINSFYKKMIGVNSYYEAAKENIKNPTLEHTQLAIDQNRGGLTVFENDFIDSLSLVDIPDSEKEKMKTAAVAAAESVKEYVRWLENIENQTPRSFRLGKTLYDQKFKFDIQSSYTADEIYQKAVAHKKELHQQMAKLASSLWNKHMGKELKPSDTLQLIRRMIDQLSLRHTTQDSFQLSIEKQIPLLVNFIKDKKLIYLDPAKPLVVRKEPAYMAGIAGASISAPGPYDKNGNTYYNVGSLAEWEKDKAESYLREYNHYVLQILNIHEAIPGHYTQLIYSNQSPSLIKSLLGNNAMIEGWAVYTERMMLENGYGNNEPEMWLMYYKWNLRSTCNTILDYSVHTKNMIKEEALHLLINEAFQQKTEAENKWRRVSLTQVQLCCYFTGYSEIYDFREQLKAQMGEKFDLKEFHEKFLSYGSAPVKYIKELMIK